MNGFSRVIGRLEASFEGKNKKPTISDPASTPELCDETMT